MRRFFSILIVVFLFSCGKSKIVNFDNINYLKSGNNLDSLCKAETERAENDIKNGKIVYFHFFGMVAKYDSDLEFNELLLKNNIKIDSALYYCTADELEYCYSNRMYREIENRHGKNFIDSLRNIADKQFITKHPDKIYDYSDCDSGLTYLDSNNIYRYLEDCEKDFLNVTEYPRGFVFKAENDTLNSFVEAEFILLKNGKVKKIETGYKFQNEANQKHAPYYSKKLKEFILKTEWIPLKNNGIVVNSRVGFGVLLK